MRRFNLATTAVVALLLMSASPAVADSTQQTLSVLGQGSVFVTPDVADLSASVTRTAASSRAALSEANTRTDAVVRATRALGVPARDIQTQDVSVSSFTVRVGHPKHRVRRWTASESIGIHITDITLVGPAIDAVTHAGASSLDGPTFSFSDPSAGAIAATRAAIADAKRRADDAAAALGYQVTGVQSVDLDPQSGVVTTPSSAAAAPTSSAPSTTPTTVHPGTQEVDAEVEIVFTIAPA